MRYVVILMACLSLVVGVDRPALAHAHLVKSQPTKGAVVQKAPSTLVLWFSEPLEPSFSTIEVTDRAGHHVEQGKATLDPGDPKVLRVSLQTLPPGSYKAVWRVVSIDTHKTNGEFAFTVAP
jgi:methionine-rich copper-binding protein CopC